MGSVVLAATARRIVLRYSIPEAPGHWPAGSLDRLVKKFPQWPKFVTFM